MKKNISLKKSFCIFAIFLLMLSCVLYSTVQRIRSAGLQVEATSKNQLLSYQLSNQLKQDSAALTSSVRSFVETGDSKFEEKYYDIIAMNTGKKPRGNGVKKSLIEQMKDAGFTPQEFDRLKYAQDLSADLVKKEKEAIHARKGEFYDGSGQYTIKREPDIDLARNLVNDSAYDTRLSQIAAPIKEFVELMNERTDHEIKNAEKVSSNAFKISISALIIMLIMSFSALAYLYRSVKNDLLRCLKAAELLATGDLRVNLKVTRKDEIGRLMIAINGIGEGISKVVTTVRKNTDSINLAASEIADGNSDLSSRTESQAANLVETASSMEEITATVHQNAFNASEANKLATTTSGLAHHGREVVNTVVSTMESIKTSSEKIIDIISIIDGIAFQTNILALNAAVEAARAGEQGRGFAAVSKEVRSLAELSASAAKEIKILILDSVEKVKQGGSQADVAGETMAEIVNSVQSLAKSINEITLASDEQSTGISMISTAILQMEMITQQNAALVEEAAAAAASLREQSTGLVSDVRVFILDEKIILS